MENDFTIRHYCKHRCCSSIRKNNIILFKDPKVIEIASNQVEFQGPNDVERLKIQLLCIRGKMQIYATNDYVLVSARLGS